MVATRRQMNWVNVGFTPTGGTLSAATGVTNVTIARNISVQKHSGDGDRFPTTVVQDYQDPRVTVTCADIIWANGLTSGARGVFTATHQDARGAVGGNITYTMTTAVVAGADPGGPHRQIGQATVTFDAESADGVTSPLAFSLA